MRIGIVTATYSPSKNGVATSTALFVRGLRAAGHEVRVFAPEHPHRNGDQELTTYRLPSTTLAAPVDYPLMLPPTAALTAKLPLADLDVIHTMHPFLAGQVALRWARALDVPLVFTAHTQYHEYVHYARMSRRLGRWLVRRHVRAFANAADLVLAPGQAMVEMLRRYRYQGEVTILPNPIDLSAFRCERGSDPRERLAIPPGAPLLVYVGRLAAEKNLEMLLASFRRLLIVRPDARLLVVGGGPLRPRLELLARGLPVHFAGSVAHDEVPGYLCAADAFVTASTSEVLPMSMIEALAAGLPLVAARSPAAHDLIRPGANGFLCAADAESIAEGLCRALDEAALPGLRRGALESAESFDLTARAADLAALYERLRCGLSQRRAA